MNEPRQEETIGIREVLEVENLRAAWKAVKANRGVAGVDGMDMDQSAEHLRAHWGKIAEKIRAGQYRPGAVLAVEIPKANGGMRKLGIPNIIDRMILQAIHQVLGPIWEAKFSESSYGFRPNRSAHDAVKAGQKQVESGRKWVVEIDLKNFFDWVNHDLLLREIRKEIRDKELLRLMGAYLRAPMRGVDRKQTARTKGTPQGGPLSPLLANIYLDLLDKELEKRGIAFVRYADDITLFFSSAKAAEVGLEKITEWIEKELKLEVNREKSGHGPSDQGNLLGFRLSNEGRIQISPKSIQKLKVKIREAWQSQQNLTSNQLRDRWLKFAKGWWNYFRLTEEKRDLQAVGGWTRRHIRKCFWQRWHSPKGRRNALSRLGVKGRGLGNASCARGAWRMAVHPTVLQALSNANLKRYGFSIPWEVAV